jgi:hypothetical protein
MKLVPISPGTGRPYGVGLRAQLNKGHSVQLMLDTGASGISISRKAAEKAGLEVLSGESMEARGLGSQKPQEAFEYLTGDVAFGDLQFADFSGGAFRSAKTSDYDGLIGADVFERFLVSIDFKDMRLTLDTYPGEPRAANEPEDATDSLPAGFFRAFRFGHHVTVHTSVNQGPLQLFLIDSGSSANLIDTDVARESTKVRGDYHTVLRGIQGRADKVARASQVSLVFAGFRQDNSDLLATNLEAIGDASGVGRQRHSRNARPAADGINHRLPERSRALRAQEMTRYFICLCMLAIPARAQDLTAQQVLDRVVSTYSNLKAVHMVAEREQTTYPAGRSRTSFSELRAGCQAGPPLFRPAEATSRTGALRERRQQYLARHWNPGNNGPRCPPPR